MCCFVGFEFQCRRHHFLLYKLNIQMVFRYKLNKNCLFFFNFREIQTAFDGKEFIANGPRLLTRICEAICGTKDRHLWTRERCFGLNLQPKEQLYPISWSHYMLYFEPNKLDEALQLTRNATMIHVWNDLSRKIWNKIGTNNAYQVIAKKSDDTIPGA